MTKPERRSERVQLRCTPTERSQMRDLAERMGYDGNVSLLLADGLAIMALANVAREGGEVVLEAPHHAILRLLQSLRIEAPSAGLAKGRKRRAARQPAQNA